MLKVEVVDNIYGKAPIVNLYNRSINKQNRRIYFLLSRIELPITERLDSNIAPAAMIGFRMPVTARLIPSVL